MAKGTIRRALAVLKRVPLLSRLDWQLYLLRDMWSSRIWAQTKPSMTPFGFQLSTRWHPAYRMMKSGEFEPEETRIFQHLLPSIDVFVDIGANVGYYCCLAIKGGKHVVAFEPQLQNLECLYQNLTVNGWRDKAEVFPVALSGSPGLLNLYGASGPSASLVENWAGYSSRFRQTVPVNTLDHVLAGRLSEQQLFVKIDVEGAEYQVLQGALATIARTKRPIWLIEVCLSEYHPSGVNPDYRRIFDLFWRNGYNCYTADDRLQQIRSGDVDRWLETTVREVKTFNYLFADAKINLPNLVRQGEGAERGIESRQLAP